MGDAGKTKTRRRPSRTRSATGGKTVRAPVEAEAPDRSQSTQWAALLGQDVHAEELSELRFTTVTAKELRAHRDPKNLVKYDSSSERPARLSDAGLSLLPLSKSTWLAFEGDAYVELPRCGALSIEAPEHPDCARMHAGLGGPKGEGAHIERVEAAGAFGLFLGIETLIRSSPGRRRMNSEMTLSIGGQRESFELHDVQFEIDGLLHGGPPDLEPTYFPIEAKKLKDGTQHVRQLWLPYRWITSQGNKCRPLVLEIRPEGYLLVEIAFDNPEDPLSWKVVGSASISIRAADVRPRMRRDPPARGSRLEAQADALQRARRRISPGVLAGFLAKRAGMDRKQAERELLAPLAAAGLLSADGDGLLRTTAAGKAIVAGAGAKEQKDALAALLGAEEDKEETMPHKNPPKAVPSSIGLDGIVDRLVEAGLAERFEAPNGKPSFRADGVLVGKTSDDPGTWSIHPYGLPKSEAGRMERALRSMFQDASDVAVGSPIGQASASAESGPAPAFPQANSPKRLAKTVGEICDKGVDAEILSIRLGLSTRQGAYYGDAAVWFGLARRDAGRFLPTEEGRRIRSLGAADRLAALKALAKSRPEIAEAATLAASGLLSQAAAERISADASSRPMAPATRARRAAGLRAWARFAAA